MAAAIAMVMVIDMVVVIDMAVAIDLVAAEAVVSVVVTFVAEVGDLEGQEEVPMVRRWLRAILDILCI